MQVDTTDRESDAAREADVADAPAGPAAQEPEREPATTSRRAAAAKGTLNLVNGVARPLYWLYERRLLSEIRAEGVLPNHIGIIMDGNRRFARAVGLDVKAGHDHGAGKAREVLDWCLELGIKHVTLWGFSTDNRGRAPDEISHLHGLFAQQARELLTDEKLHKNRVRVKIIGDTSDFPESARRALRAMEDATQSYDNLFVNVALGYGGREEIVDAVNALLRARLDAGEELATVAGRVGADEITRHVYTAGLPDPDFVIRTSGEVRLSGFMLWQTAYSEFYFCDANWPEFRKVDFLRALRDFQARERRYGR
ncbi:MAG TPA: polyprenyl diphosphate synthase [Trueperaceae bacterium]|nr:polyprenyl diphosphate synthase [Trueperaceae bacterium]